MINIQYFLEKTSFEICKQLNSWLPVIGGDNWWRFYVYDQLSVGQQRNVSQETGSLSDFDLQALLRVLMKNWPELCNHREQTNLKRSGLTYVREVIDIRNEWAHKKVGAILDKKDSLRYLDTLSRLIKEISGNPDLIEELNLAWDALLNQSNNEFDNNKSNSTKHKDTLDEEKKPDPIKTIEELKDIEKASQVLVTGITNDRVKSKLKEHTYLGIDFGTSTTVITLVQIDSYESKIMLTPLAIRQPTVFNDFVEHYLVNSVLTLHRNKILFGKDAYRLKIKHIEGESTFSSFKMRLGVQGILGYPNSKVTSIKSAQDATTQFLIFLKKEILISVESLKLSQDLKFAISVPASFEANQRLDLVKCLDNAGFKIESSGLIDEPNAAFLSYLNESAVSNNDFINSLKNQIKTILIYDFGAGTCDVSILQVKIQGSTVITKNLAISRFMALGGDDIDRSIVKKVLINTLKVNDRAIDENSSLISNEEINNFVIPWLMPTAEKLKINCTDHLRDLQIDTIQDAREVEYFSQADTPENLVIQNKNISLDLPSISLSMFVDIVESFSKQKVLNNAFEDEDQDDDIGEPKYLYAPVENALGKAELLEKDVDALLFIGGSSKNPLVRNLISRKFTATTKIIVPKDLQTHVSQGAALHSLCLHGLGMNVIQPIISEPIFVITKGSGLKLIIPAGSAVPSENEFEEILTVSRDGQYEIELPLCVSNENKILGIIRISSPHGKAFIKGEQIIFRCLITADKLIEATVSVSGLVKKTALLNPLSNTELSPKELLMLEAKQIYNESILNNNGRPTSQASLAYASALQSAGLYLDAAEQFIQCELMRSNLNHSTSICYCYSMGGKKVESNRWGKIAYERSKTYVTAYNHALSFSSSDPQYEYLLRECLSIDPSYPPALKLLGILFKNKGHVEGVEYLEKASEILLDKLNLQNISQSECDLFIGIEEVLGRDDYLEKISSRKKIMIDLPRVFHEENLASTSSQIYIAKG